MVEHSLTKLVLVFRGHFVRRSRSLIVIKTKFCKLFRQAGRWLDVVLTDLVSWFEGLHIHWYWLKIPVSHSCCSIDRP